MIQAHTIQVNLKPEIIAQIDDTAIAHLHIKTSENTSTLKKWMRYGSEKLTHYSFLIALSEVFSLPVEDLVEVHRSQSEHVPNTKRTRSEHVKPKNNEPNRTSRNAPQCRAKHR